MTKLCVLDELHNDGIDRVVVVEVASANRRIEGLDDQLFRTEIERDNFERVRSVCQQRTR